MRKITEQAVNAFKLGKNFKGSNTRVENRNNETFLYLFDNLIAHKYTEKGQDKLFVSTCGWRSNTTKERLNGLLNAYDLGTIYQRNFVWYFTDLEQSWSKQTRTFNI